LNQLLGLITDSTVGVTVTLSVSRELGDVSGEEEEQSE